MPVAGVFGSEVRLPETAGNRRLAAVAGDLLFTGAVTPHEIETGKLAKSIEGMPSELRSVQTGRYRTDLHQERAVAQAWRIYATLAALLEQNGSSLDLLVRQRLYLTDARDLPVIERVMDLFLRGSYPATSIVIVPSAGVQSGLVFQLDGVALLAGDHRSGREAIDVSGAGKANDRYPNAVRAGQLVFVSNTVGENPETGRMAISREEVPSDADWLVQYALTSSKEEALLAQGWHLFKNIERVLETQGCGLADVLKVNGWAAFPMIEAEPVFTVREHLFPTRDAMPASATVGIEGIAREGALMGYDCVAVAPSPGGEGYRKEVRGEVYGLVPMLVPAAQAGPFIFTCGDVAIDSRRRRVIESFDDLEGDGRALPFGRMHAAPTIEAQAHFVYGIHQASLSEHGASMQQVVHQTVFLRDPSHYEALQTVAALYYGAQIPPTTVVPVHDTSPWAGNLLEIEMIAALE